MNVKQRIVTLISLLLIGICIIANAPMAMASSTATVAVLATSDLHGNILNYDYLTGTTPTGSSTVGLAKIATLVLQERSKYPCNILVDNGDFLQGTPLDAYYATVNTNWLVHPMVSVFNYMKYDAINIGNHEFNFGLDFLKKAAIHSEAQFLSANTRFVLTNTYLQHVKPYIIKHIDVSKITGVEHDKLRIGIIGTVTPAIPNFESPANYQGLNFIPQENAINMAIADLKRENVDAIIVLSHSGVPSASSPYPENGIVAIANKCTGINLIVSGHTHVLTDNTHGVTDTSVSPSVSYPDGVINGVPTMAPYRWGAYLSEALITFEKTKGKWQVRGVSTANLSTNGVADDPGVVSLAQPWDAATKAYLATPLGKSTAPFPGKDGYKTYTALVDFVNKVQMYYGNADISAAASFNDTALIPQGTVTLQNVSSVYIYENYMFTIQITGKQLKQYLEKSASYFSQVASGTPVDAASLPYYTSSFYTAPSYNYDMISGVSYQINISKPVGSRIQNLTFKGKPVQDTDTFKFAINNYRYNGGGGFMSAMGLDALGKTGTVPTVLWDSQKTMGDGGQVRNLIASYIKLQGTITPNNSANWNLVSK